MKKPKKTSNKRSDEEDSILFKNYIEKTNWHSLCDLKDHDIEPKKSVTKKKSSKTITKKTLDLHGLNLEESKNLIDKQIQTFSNSNGSSILLTIITGKGIHSQNGGVLCKEIHHYMTSHYGHLIDKIDVSPNDVRIGGIPLRGHFQVVLSKYTQKN